MAQRTNLAEYAVTRLKAEAANIRKPTQQQARLPAPIGGLNFINSTMDFPSTDAYVMDNFIARPYGVEIRKGWRYWVPEANSFPDEVRTIMAFNAQNSNNSKLFCSTAEATGKVYDVTSNNLAPILAFTPSSAPDTPGEWYYTNYVTPGGAFLCTVSAGAGYYVYSSTGGWVEYITGSGAGKIEFPAGDATTTDDFAFIWSWKNRLWFLKRNSPVAYYLPVNAISGKVAAFDFGAQLQHGGALNWAASWTYDSGAGIDDSLVLASNEGEVLIYQGTDPATAANFALKGSWYAGRFPYGRRCYCQHGGDLLMLDEYGLVSIADLVAGRLHTSEISGTMGHKVNPRLARIVTSVVADKYWFMIPYATEEFLLVGSPFTNEDLGVRQSFIMNSITNAWSTISEVDLLCAENWKGRLIVGTRTGDIQVMFDGWNDGVSADGSDVGSAVTGRLQGVFHDYGSPNANKRMLRTKLYGLADSTPSFAVFYRAEYELGQMITVGAPVAQQNTVWDVALWDDALWKSSSSSFRRWIGVNGWGKKLSLQMAVRGAGRVLFTDFEALFETGIGL